MIKRRLQFALSALWAPAARPLRIVSKAAAVLVSGSLAAGAVEVTWTGANTGQSWNTGSNWSTVAIPGTSETALFSHGAAALSVGLGAAQSVYGVGFQATGSQTSALTGGSGLSLTLGAGGLSVAGTAGAVTLGGPLVSTNFSIALGADQSWSNSSSSLLLSRNNIATGGNRLTVGGSGPATLNGVISGTGGLSKTGSGTLILGGANTFTGGILLDGGVLQQGVANALGSNAVTFSGGSAGVLKLNSQNATMAKLVSDALNTGTPVVQNGGGSAATLTIGDANNFSGTFAGAIEDGGGGQLHLNKAGSGTLVLSGINTYTGTTTISGGRLKIETSASLGFSDLVNGSVPTVSIVAGASSIATLCSTGVSNTLAKPVTTTGSGNYNLEVTGSGVFTLTGGISGNNGPTKIGTGTLVLDSDNTATGLYTVDTGTLRMGSNGSLPSSDVDLTINEGAVFDLNGRNVTVGTFSGNLTLTGGAITTGSGVLSVNETTPSQIVTGASAVSSTISGYLDLGNMVREFNVADGAAGDDLVVPAVLSRGGLRKTGQGTMVVSGASSYGDKTLVDAGILGLGASESLPNTTALTVAGGAGFKLYDKTETVASIAGAGDIDLGASGAGKLIVGGGNASMVFPGTISGSGHQSGGGLFKVGTGTLTLSGNSSFAGDLRIQAGAVSFSVLAAAGSDQPLGRSDSGKTIYLGVDGVSSGTLSYTGITGELSHPVTVLGAGSAIKNSGSGLLTLSGGILQSSGTLELDGGGLGIALASGVSGAATSLSIKRTVNLEGAFLEPSTPVVVHASAVLTIGSGGSAVNQTVGGLSGSGSVAGGHSGTSTLISDQGPGLLTFSGVLGGGGTNDNHLAFTKSGSGTLELSGSSSNTATGLTTVEDGKLILSKFGGNTAVGGDLMITGGTLEITGSEQISDAGNVVITGGAFNFAAASSGSIETVGTLTNSGGIFSTGPNAVVGTGNSIYWSGGSNTVNAGGMVADGHFLVTGGTNTVEGGSPAGGVLYVLSGGAGLEFDGTGSPAITLDSSAASPGSIWLESDVTVLPGLTSGTAQILNGGSAAGSGYVDMAGSTRTFTVNDGSGTSDLLISASLINGGIVKTGAGTMALSGANTYAGDTEIIAGTLLLQAGETLPDGSSVVLGGGTLHTGGYPDTAGILSVTSTSIIDMGDASSTLHFANTSGLAIAGQLKVYNWSGALWGPGGSDQITFPGYTGSRYFQGNVQFYSDAGTTPVGYGAMITGSGELVPVPEAGPTAAGLLLLGVAGWLERRHFLRCPGARAQG